MMIEIKNRRKYLFIECYLIMIIKLNNILLNIVSSLLDFKRDTNFLSNPLNFRILSVDKTHFNFFDNALITFH